jgi:hypothetical protein
MSNWKKRYYLILHSCEIVDIKLTLLASIRSTCLTWSDWYMSSPCVPHFKFVMHWYTWLLLCLTWCWVSGSIPLVVMIQYQTLMLAFVVSTCFKVTSWLVNAFPHSHMLTYALTVEELKEMCNYVLSLGLSIKNKLTQDVLIIYLKNKVLWKVWLCLFVVSLPYVSLCSLVCSHEPSGPWNFL